MQKSNFKKEYIHPANGYSQVVSITSGNTKTLYISGQIGEGKDLEAQMHSVFSKLKIELETCGATYKDIVKINTYIVNYKEEYYETFRRIRREVLGTEEMPASTLIGVTSLAKSEYLIEMDAIAVIPLDKTNKK
ncbi:hypothetical protein AD998_03595 [bacterium 336/3]|nr:hypothetical protein AD998_03595 [bacterium 336/3]